MQTASTLDVSLKEAYASNETYRRASWVSLGLALTISAFSNYIMVIYSAQLFTSLTANKDSFSLQTCTILQAFMCLFGASLCTLTLPLTGRRTLLLIGQGIGTFCIFTILLLNLTQLADL